MIEKDPGLYSIVTYVWVILLSAWGGAINFWGKMKRGEARAINIMELFGELMTSAFAGMLTYWLCQSAHIDQFLTAALVGVAGHMGSRAIFMLEKWLGSKLPQ